VCIWFAFPTFFLKMYASFFLHFLHKTYNADNIWMIDQRKKKENETNSLKKNNEQTANETKKKAITTNTHTE
jgi:hypothetical protein